MRKFFSTNIRTLSLKEFIIWRETIKSLIKILYRVRIEKEKNLEKISLSKGLIVVSNHQAGIDGFLVGMLLPKHLHVIMNAKAFPNPIILKVAHHFGVIPYIPRVSSEWTNQQIAKILSNKEFVGIFPEGAIHPLKKDYYGKKGFARFAIKTKTPVLPIGIKGTQIVTPKGTFSRGIAPPPFRKLILRIGDPIKPLFSSKKVDDEEIIYFRDKIMAKIRDLSDWYGVPQKKIKELKKYYKEKELLK